MIGERTRYPHHYSRHYYLPILYGCIDCNIKYIYLYYDGWAYSLPSSFLLLPYYMVILVLYYCISMTGERTRYPRHISLHII